MDKGLLDDYTAKCRENCTHTGIFVDYDNIYYSLKEYGVDPENEDFHIIVLNILMQLLHFYH